MILRSLAQTVARVCPLRPLTISAAKKLFRALYAMPAAAAARTLLRPAGTASCAPRRRPISYRTPAIAAGPAIWAWLLSVPYQGIRPRISRESKVPSTPTSPAAAGPPKIMLARSGAEPTDTVIPAGRLIGNALATSVTAIQKVTPRGPPISGRTGKTAIAATRAIPAAAT